MSLPPTFSHLTIKVYRSKSFLSSEKWRWRATTDNGEIVATSGEGYSDFTWAAEMADRLFDKPMYSVTFEYPRAD